MSGADKAARFRGRCRAVPPPDGLADPCWRWLGTRSAPDGYGRLSVDGGRRYVLAHREAFALFVGPIPAGRVVHHVCRNRWCCQPAHLEALTVREHVARHDSPPGVNARKAACGGCGEPFTHRTNDGRRVCRPCRARLQRAWKRRQAVTT